MYVDDQNELSNAQAFTTGANNSEDVIDMTVAGDAEKALWLIIRVHTTFTSGGAGTLQVTALHDTEAAFGDAPVTFFDSGVIAKGTLVAGYTIVKMRLPANMGAFMKCVYTVAAADMTAGKLDAFLTPDVDHKSNYSN